MPKDLAAELTGPELPPIEAVRYFERTYIDDCDNLQTYIELKINVLEREPTREEIVAEEIARLEQIDVGALNIDRQKAPSVYLDMARALKRAARAEDAATVLKKLLDAHENGEHAPPAAWKDLAVILSPAEGLHG